MAMAIALGGVSVSASYTADNLTRGGTYATLEATESPEIAEEGVADGEGNVADVEAAGGNTEAVTDGEAETGPAAGENNPTAGEENGALDDGENNPTAGEENGALDDGVNNPEGTDENTDKSGDVSQNGGISNEAGVESDADVEANEAGDTEAANPFAVMFEAVKDYATEIFCSLSLVCSLVLAYCYKRGLIPLLSGGLNSLSGVIKSVKESTERGEGETRELARIITARLSEAESALDIITASIGDLSARLDTLSEDKREKEQMKVILGAQVDMLYSIFMTSALPQYQKDEVGERIAEMRGALGLSSPLKGGAAVEGE